MEETLNGKMSIKVQFSLLTKQKICVVPYGTERPCGDVSSAGTELMAVLRVLELSQELLPHLL